MAYVLHKVSKKAVDISNSFTSYVRTHSYIILVHVYLDSLVDKNMCGIEEKEKEDILN